MLEKGCKNCHERTGRSLTVINDNGIEQVQTSTEFNIPRVVHRRAHFERAHNDIIDKPLSLSVHSVHPGTGLLIVRDLRRQAQVPERRSKQRR